MMTLGDRGAATGATGRATEPWGELEEELGLLCQGLIHAWNANLRAVSTTVGLPGDARSERELCALCGRVAAPFGLCPEVRRAGDAWAVRFSLPVAAEGARAARPVALPGRLGHIRAGYRARARRAVGQIGAAWPRGAAGPRRLVG